MCTIQPERCGGMVKIPCAPCTGVVAAVATSAVVLLVDVIVCMACITVHGRIAELRCQMTFFAIGMQVTAGQYKACLVVIVWRVVPC